MGRVQLRETLRVPQGTVLDIDTLELGLVHLKDTDRCIPKAYHGEKLVPLRASDRHSPLWTGNFCSVL